MSDAIGMMSDRKERAPLIRFERIVEENIPASREAGHFVPKEVGYAVITPPYSSDVNKHELPAYWDKLQRDVQGGRFKQEWLDHYKKAYRAFCDGQELPVNGIPIRGWGVISPAQQESLTRMNILTVEDLAEVNDEGMKRIGMGAIDLKNKARAWLQQLTDKGPLVQEIAAVKKENGVLQGTINGLIAKVEQLTAMVQAQNMGMPATPQQQDGISASDILDEPEPVVRRGRPPKQQATTL